MPPHAAALPLRPCSTWTDPNVWQPRATGRASVSGAREHPAERASEERVFLGRPDRDTDRRRGAEAVQRADDHALAEQPLKERLGVLAHVDVEEVADGALRRLEPVLAQGRRETNKAVGVQLAAALDLGGVVDARERRDLRG